MKHILGIGNALVDALYRVEDDAILEELKLPKGSMQLIDTARYQAVSGRMATAPKSLATGGSACNTILALAALGARPGLIGKVGRDEQGAFFADNCRNLGIRTFLLRNELPTGVASTFITPDAQRTFGTYLGAAACLEAGDVTPDMLSGYAYIYIEGYLVQNHDLIDHVIRLAHEAGLRVCLDMASYNIVEADCDFFAHLLRHTDIVFANEEEALAFTGLPPREAVGRLAEICRVAVVKMGAEGAVACSGRERSEIGAIPVCDVVDTTAAGDFFSAGFLYNHARGRDLYECLSAGTRLASEIIRVVGTHLDEATWRVIRAAVG